MMVAMLPKAIVARVWDDGEAIGGAIRLDEGFVA